MAKFGLTPLLPFYDSIEEVCTAAFRAEEDISPLALLERLMDIPNLPMHCPPHHYIMPALLLTVVNRDRGCPEDSFLEQLAEAKDRALEVPGGFCGWYGSCGAAVGVGIFLSVYTGTDPHSEEFWGECNLVTGRALQAIGEISGPRCCKRNSYIALQSALASIQEILHISLPKTGSIHCKYHERNAECKGTDCPFYTGE